MQFEKRLPELRKEGYRMKKQSKKKPTALAEYAALMVRVAEYCAYERKCEAAEDTVDFDARHGGTEKCPSKAELEKAKRELVEAGEPVDDYNVKNQVVKDRKEAAKPSAPSPDVSPIGQPLVFAQVFGGDPFPKEWEELHNELVTADLPDRVCAEIERRHSELVALFQCADNGADGIEDAAHSFNDFLLGLLTTHANANKIGYQGGMSQAEFAKKIGKDISTIKRWERGEGTPDVFDPQLGKRLTYSADLRKDRISATTFILYYHRQRSDKQGIKNAVQHMGEATDQWNERKRRGYTKATCEPSATYDGDPSQLERLAKHRLGYGGKG